MIYSIMNDIYAYMKYIYMNDPVVPEICYL